MAVFILLALMSLLGWATGLIAEGKGRDRYLWTMLGAFLGMAPLIVACAMSDQGWRKRSQQP